MLQLRIDVHVHFDMPGLSEVAALTGQLRARNDTLADVVSTLSEQTGLAGARCGDNSVGGKTRDDK